MQAAEVDTKICGSGFPTKKDSPYSRWISSVLDLNRSFFQICDILLVCDRLVIVIFTLYLTIVGMDGISIFFSTIVVRCCAASELSVVSNFCYIVSHVLVYINERTLNLYLTPHFLKSKLQYLLQNWNQNWRRSNFWSITFCHSVWMYQAWLYLCYTWGWCLLPSAGLLTITCYHKSSTNTLGPILYGRSKDIVKLFCRKN